MPARPRAGSAALHASPDCEVERAGRELLDLARAGLSAGDLEGLERTAEQDIASFRDRMRPEAYRVAAQAALDRLVRERFGLPTLKY